MRTLILSLLLLAGCNKPDIECYCSIRTEEYHDNTFVGEFSTVIYDTNNCRQSVRKIANIKYGATSSVSGNTITTDLGGDVTTVTFVVSNNERQLICQ